MTLNLLVLHCQIERICPLAAMDALQGAGAVADCAVIAEDVASADQARAVEWLRNNALQELTMR